MTAFTMTQANQLLKTSRTNVNINLGMESQSQSDLLKDKQREI